MEEAEESEDISLQSDNMQETEDNSENILSPSEESEMDNLEQFAVPGATNKIPFDTPNLVLAPDHPLMIKYQQDLKERLLKLLLETDEQLNDLVSNSTFP